MLTCKQVQCSCIIIDFSLSACDFYLNKPDYVDSLQTLTNTHKRVWIG